ncbi:MAG: FtsX-like permease family protein [Bacteroidetes bacterium]|nr:MAG: FtsX-like permease family protein [Bacteroidota bacterium]
MWKEDFEVTLGAMAAERLNLAVGDTFISTHGLAAAAEAHAEHPFRVAGILAPSGSVLDQLILTGLESVWHTHAHEGEAEEPKEITALLIHLRNPIGLFQLPRYINEQTNMQAAVPAYEINRLLQKLLPGAISVIQGLALLIMAISGLSMFLSLLERLRERRYELALMRSLGASRMRLFWLLLAEGSFLSLAGCLAGLMMSRIGIVLLNLFIKDAYPYGFSPFNVLAAELWMIPAVAGMGFAAALLPAIQAFRLNLSQTLSDA